MELGAVGCTAQVFSTRRHDEREGEEAAPCRGCHCLGCTERSPFRCASVQGLASRRKSSRSLASSASSSTSCARSIANSFSSMDADVVVSIASFSSSNPSSPLPRLPSWQASPVDTSCEDEHAASEARPLRRRCGGIAPGSGCASSTNAQTDERSHAAPPVCASAAWRCGTAPCLGDAPAALTASSRSTPSTKLSPRPSPNPPPKP
mmetsp:Transcript_3644/g.9277  ORF Transcript_3644/g.9277 Transcript_3644/m.9277 type:complete len:206 (+) Transcript_3644:222-839(+)